MDTLPPEIHELIFDYLSYAEIKAFGMTNKDNEALVKSYLSHRAQIIRRDLYLDNTLSDTELIEIIYYLNNDLSNRLDGIGVSYYGENFYMDKGNNAYSHEVELMNEYDDFDDTPDRRIKWVRNNEMHREGGPALIETWGSRVEKIYYVNGVERVLR